MHPSAVQLCRYLALDEIEATLGALCLPSKDLIFMPVSDSDDPERAQSGSHWTLLLWAKRDRAFHYYDSSSGSAASREASQEVAAALEPLLVMPPKLRGLLEQGQASTCRFLVE